MIAEISKVDMMKNNCDESTINVWCMNLKDNRDKDQNKEIDKKFNTCIENHLVAIGWGVENPDLNWEEYKRFAQEYYGSDKRSARSFLYAVNQMEAIKPGDLIWSKNPKSKEYYIFRVCESVRNETNIEMNRVDIGSFCEVDSYCRIRSKEYLPKGITWRNLISRTALRPVRNLAVAQKTKEYFDEHAISF